MKSQKLRKIICLGLASWDSITHANPKETYIPPTEEESLEKYQNDIFFNRVVNNMVTAILENEGECNGDNLN